MLRAPKGLVFLFLGNLIPFLLGVLIIATALLSVTPFARVAVILFEIYLLPPLVYRLLPHQKAQGTFEIHHAPFRTWWVGVQLQALYLRFPALEEILRVIPFVYSNWLRLWGAEIGPRVYWSPRLVIMDRPQLRVGSQVIVGYGVGFTAHHFNLNAERGVLVLANAVIEDGAVLGGESRIGPGARVGRDEMLPATMALAPFYEWRGGRRKALAKDSGLGIE